MVLQDDVQVDSAVPPVPDLLRVDDDGRLDRGFQTDFDVDESLRVAATVEEGEPTIDDPRELLAEEDVSLPEGATFGGLADRAPPPVRTRRACSQVSDPCQSSNIVPRVSSTVPAR